MVDLGATQDVIAIQVVIGNRTGNEAAKYKERLLQEKTEFGKKNNDNNVPNNAGRVGQNEIFSDSK